MTLGVVASLGYHAKRLLAYLRFGASPLLDLFGKGISSK